MMGRQNGDFGREKRLQAACAALATVVILAGCGSSGNYSSGDSYAGSYNEKGVAAAAAESAYDTGALYDSEAMSDYYEEDYVEAPANGSEPVQAETPQDTSRKLITTMSIHAETDDMDKLLAHVENKVQTLGGYIESSDISNGSSRTYGNTTRQTRNANLTLRVPAKNLAGFVSDFQERSNITSSTKNVEDVTLTYADIDSHKRMLKKEEERLLDFMSQAETVEDMITVESRLTDVQYQLDSMESQLRTYDNKINYSTVYLYIEEVVEFTVVEEAPKTMWEEIGEGFMENLESVIDWFKDLFVWFVTHIPQLIVWAIVIFIIVQIIRTYRRKKREREAEIIANGGTIPLTPRQQRKRAKEEEKAAKKRMKMEAEAAKKGVPMPPAPGPQTPGAPAGTAVSPEKAPDGQTENKS